jgi:hypothetical protein
MTSKRQNRPIPRRAIARGWQPDWDLQTIMVKAVGRGNRGLAIVLMHGAGLWMATAVESINELGVPARPSAHLAQKMMAQVFDDHAHEVLPPQRSLEAAMKVADAYARWWLGSRKRGFRCPCKPIGVAA